MTKGACRACNYYDQVTHTYGHCKRHAPQAGIGYPMVPPENWCGEFDDKV